MTSRWTPQGQHHVHSLSSLSESLKSLTWVPMYSGLPEDVNISPVSVQPDLWLCKVSAVSWAKQRGQSRDTLPQVSPPNCFSFTTNVADIWRRIFFAFWHFSLHQQICLFPLAGNKVWVIAVTASWSLLAFDFQTELAMMETEQTAASCPALGQTPVRSWLSSSSRGTVLRCCWLSRLVLNKILSSEFCLLTKAATSDQRKATFQLLLCTVPYILPGHGLAG